MTCVGTIVSTEKNEWAAHDVPFLKLSNGARNMVERGWYREAVIKMKAEQSNHAYYIQCTTWKDKKQVKFLSNNNVGRSVGLFMKRRVLGKKTKNIIPGPRAQADYVENFKAVDRNNRNSQDYCTSICKNCYYIRIFCWALDRVIHAAYVIVCILSKAGMGPKQWKQYENKNFGHHNFQIDLAIDLMNCSICCEWEGVSKERPSFMQKGPLVPCECNECFFCVKGSTNGIIHRPSKKAWSMHAERG